MTLTYLITGAIIGTAFGIGEAIVWRKRIARNDRRQLPHGYLLTGRVLLCLLLGLYLLPWAQLHILEAGLPEPPAWRLVIKGAAAAFIPLVMQHRVCFNSFTGRPFWYMGDAQHKPGDALYDTLMWSIAALLWLWTKRWHDSLVWVTAMMLETTALYIVLR